MKVGHYLQFIASQFMTITHNINKTVQQ